MNSFQMRKKAKELAMLSFKQGGKNLKQLEDMFYHKLISKEKKTKNDKIRGV